ncbi:polysaccharide deacetylase family protein [Bradyrhizobium sp. 147]|jgi:peptidoglycan/xylan/chitin deacetylase (PgdA/CDA1 family)|uniref:polysaccharide deacetylase family protein n=1 Tax=unclassified Bradyrhizobium TaxID=2631580 RepID=UPI001FF9C614|nr:MULTISPECIES: polysaccharide deacetylase family protein [unclassified Bradyrhizobium]MCK1543027.1 polysaccharide deacetylase family protein [Bradyrhizobium sp. 179]MCK1627636.1 polysaccharide deacetylase family protein [Bradyrhizobium sp. 160]MCK1677942.1 polysaccharide deacetylase family protein [Bradyrhizobium sp. 147]
MRNALGLMLASVVAAVVIAAGGWFYYSARADQGAPKTVAARAADPLPAPAKLAAKDDVETTAAIAAKPAAAAPSPAPAMPVQQKQACANPNALGVARVVEIDTTGGPGFGFEHFKQFDFLTEKEVVLTFDDGPWPVNTPAVLKALADECTKGLFFSVGKHATYHPEILRQVLAQGHTVGTHTWSHVNLNSKKMTEQQVKDEVEKGFSAVRFALGTNPAPFFRFPQLQHNPAMVTYFGTRNVAMFSTDIDSFDFRKGATPEKIVETVMTRLDKLGKGIILMHDFQKHTGEAMPGLLARLKAGGYKIVQMKAKTSLQTLPEYDEALLKDLKVPTSGTNSRPISSVVQTVSQ